MQLTANRSRELLNVLHKVFTACCKLSAVCFNIWLCIASVESFSQSKFPDLSAKGSLKQNVGFTVIAVEYERPSVRGRKIFGELVPFDKVWRTGAGKCTMISFSEPVTINDRKVDAGTYALLTIPGIKEWTIILNRDTTLYGTRWYDEKKDVIRFTTKSEPASRFYESFTIDVDIVPHNAVLYLAWENTHISFLVETGADKKTGEFISNNLLSGNSSNAEEYAAAVEYYFYLNKDLDKAITLIEKAIVIDHKQPWYYNLKVDILEKQGKFADALETANAELECMQKYGVELGWDAETLKVAVEGCKSRMDSLRKKIQ